MGAALSPSDSHTSNVLVTLQETQEGNEWQALDQRPIEAGYEAPKPQRLSPTALWAVLIS